MIIKNILYYNKDYNFYYLPILKNAHTWGEFFFKENFDFKQQGTEPIEFYNEKKVIVFYRNPLNRWFSGAAQWFSIRMNNRILPPTYKIDQLMMELIFSAGKLDDHTKLQRESFGNIQLDKCWFFDTENLNFEKNLVHFLENVQNVKVKNPIIKKRNTIEENELKLNIRQQLKRAHHDNKEFQKLLTQYLKWDIIDYYRIKTNNMFYEATELK